MTIQAAPTAKVPRTALIRKRLPAILGAIASLTILFVALWFLQRQLSGLSFSSIIAHTRSIPILTLLAAIGFTTCSYLVLTGFDAAGLRYLRCHVPYRHSALTSFMAFAVGHNVGFSALSGGSIRYRMYTLAGLTAADIAKLIVFIAGTYSLGAAGLLGVALLRMPEAQSVIFKVQPEWVALAGTILLMIPFIYITATVVRRKPVRIGNWRLTMPRPALATTQVALSIGDLVFAAATLYILLEPLLHIGFLPFLGVYLLAMGAGVLSGVPGGLGVFEAVLVAAFPQVEVGALLGIIILYRMIYYLGPLAMALLLLVGHEAHHHGQVLKESTAKAVDWLSGIAPQLIGSTVFMAGVVLLISGASPATPAHLTTVSRTIPLPALELSHLLASVVGITLLILSRGLFRRLEGAYRLAFVALAAGMILSLGKGLDYAEALFLGGSIVALWFSRDEFSRRDAIIAQRFPWPWIVAIALVLCVTLVTGFLSFSHVDYANWLWWQFAYDAQASRMLRATFFALATGISFACLRALRSEKRQFPPLATPADLARVRKVLDKAQTATANVALLGDKRFLWSADQQAFIMYQISGDSWIAYGDPVGPSGNHQELAWAFRELADSYDGYAVFYEVSDESLALYVDLGLTLSKIGENATVSLQDFSLDIGRFPDLGQANDHAATPETVFEIVPRTSVEAILPDLRHVSDQWHAVHPAAEKSFALGAFSEEYIVNFDCAVVTVNKKIVAFANLWPATAGGELSVDLMRYDPKAPEEIMDYLFVELMLWGKANGYRSFSFGMVPLQGLEERSLAPVWHKIGHRIFMHGEHYKNVRELRSYKNKFNPQWQPRYLACPGGWRKLPRALVDAARLIDAGQHDF